MTMIFYLFLLQVFSLVIANQKEFKRHAWKKPYEYYYRTLEEKLSMILRGDCRKKFHVLAANSDIIVPTDRNEINAIPYEINAIDLRWWSSIAPPKQMRVDPRICSSVYNAKKRPIFNAEGCQLPDYMSPSAPRCQTKYLKYNCDNSQIPINESKPNHFILPESIHQNWQIPPIPWIITARDSLVNICGHISSSCGIIHTTANCRAYSFNLHSSAFRRSCPLPKVEQKLLENPGNTSGLTYTCSSDAPWSNIVQYHDKVFVIAEVDDTYIYHIHLEIVPRIIYHLKFLQENPDVKILYGCDSKNKKEVTEAGLRQGFQQMLSILKLFNLDQPHRFIIHQHVYAKEVYLPMEGGCQDPVYNTWTILHMRRQVFQLLNLQDREPISPISRQASSRKPIISIVKRSANSVHTRNKHDLVRQWSDDFAKRILEGLRVAFPDYEVRMISDRNHTLMNCFECQVKAFAETDVLIGVHGAGLGMSLYMPPNSAVVEITPYPNDGRCLLGGGPFSRLATVMGHNYMMHQPPYQEFVWKKDKTSEFNISSLIEHTSSFLRSIEFI